MVSHLSIFSSKLLKIALKLLVWIVIIYILNIAFYSAISKSYFHLIGGNSGSQINFTIKQKHDVFIFGASRAMHHYNPIIIKEKLNLSVFNAGDDGKNSTYQLGLLAMLLKHHEPKVIVYEVGDLTKSLDKGTVDLFPYYYKDNDVKHLLIQRDKYCRIKISFRAYAYNQKIFTILSDYLRKKKPVIGGYHPLYGNISPDEIKSMTDDKKTPIDFGNLDLFAVKNFESFAQLCMVNNVKLIYVYSPTYTGSKPSGETIIKSIAEKYKIQYYSYSSDKRFYRNSELFKDNVHLNDKGASLFSQDLGIKIESVISQFK
jgi:hypothetical protein